MEAYSAATRRVSMKFDLFINILRCTVSKILKNMKFDVGAIMKLCRENTVLLKI
jgi:hypothetical protein